MARVYKFQNADKTIDVDILVDAIDDVKHFLIVDVHDLQKSEIILGFDLSRDGYYYEKEFVEYATEKEYNLYRWDNQSYVGQLHEATQLSDWYQELPLGLTDDLTNIGQGGSLVDGLLIFGSMTTKDIVFDWIRDDVLLQNVADTHNVINPMTYAGLEVLPAYPRYEIDQDENTISRLKLPEQEVFNTVPIQSGDDWIFEGGTNNVTVKNNQALQADGVGVGLLYWGKYIRGGTPIDLTLYFNRNSLNTATQTLFYCGGDLDTYKGLNVYLIPSLDYLYVRTSEGVSRLTIATPSVLQYFIDGVNEMNIIWPNITGGTIIITLNGTEIVNSTNTKSWDGDSTFYPYYFSKNTSHWFDGDIYRIVSNIDGMKFDCSLSDQHGGFVRDMRGLNDLTVINNAAYDTWQARSSKCEPVPLTRGCFIQSNSITSNKIIKTFDSSDIFTNDDFESLFNNAPTVNAPSGGTDVIRTLLISLTEPTKIQLEQGTYEELDVGYNEFPAWIIGVTGSIINGNGLRTDNSPSDYIFAAYQNQPWNTIPLAWKHTLWTLENLYVSNVEFTSDDVKYDVHSDGVGSFQFGFYNCLFNGGYEFNVGIGGYIRQSRNFIDCQFDKGVFYHDTTNQGFNTLSFINCVSNQDLLTIVQQPQTNDYVHELNLINCTNQVVNYGSTNAANQYTINVNNYNSTLTINETDRINYLAYINNYLSVGIFKNLVNTYLGIKYDDWETNEKTFDEIAAIPIIPSNVMELTKTGDVFTGWKVIKE